MTIRRRGWSAGRRSGDVDGSWRSGVRAQIFHQPKSGRGHLAPDRVGPSQRQGGAVMLDQRDSAHRAATGLALRAVVGRNARGIGVVPPCLVALFGACRPVRGGCIVALGGLRSGHRGRRVSSRRRAMAGMSRRRHRPCKRQQDDQRGRLQCRREGAEWTHAIPPIRRIQRLDGASHGGRSMGATKRLRYLIPDAQPVAPNARRAKSRH